MSTYQVFIEKAKRALGNIDLLEEGFGGRRVLVTGGTGFIGSHLVNELLADWADPVATYRSWDAGAYGTAPKTTYCDVTNYQQVCSTLSRYEPEFIFHLAAQPIVTKSKRYPYDDWDINCRGTYNLLQGIKETGINVKAFILASTDKVYGDAPIPYVETSPLAGSKSYEVSKICQEMITRTYCTDLKIPFAITRCANVYGPGDRHPDRLIPQTIRTVMEDKAPCIRSDGYFMRDFLYISDCVAGYMRLAKMLDGFPNIYSGQVFNFSNDPGHYVIDVVELIIDKMGGKHKPYILNEASSEIREQQVSYQKAVAALQWKPEVSFDEGIERTIEWMKNYDGYPS